MTGPKISSREIRISGVTSAKTVGSHEVAAFESAAEPRRPSAGGGAGAFRRADST